jgi:asparagine synthase (glutamine-hydrolysing)
MITGSVSFTGLAPSFIPAADPRSATDITFFPVRQPGFEGGFCLHAQLPYKAEDKYFTDESGDIAVLMAGSVYNKHDLLRPAGIATQPSDPELIAGMFLEQGPGFVRNLNGDFAIFIIRPAKKESFLFRDHLGIKALAWVAERGALLFSTDILGLCRAFEKNTPVDPEYLLGYFKYVDYRRTPNERIRKLPPGHYLHFSGTGIELTKYWEPEKIKIDRNLSYDRMLSDLKDMVLDAVTIRCDQRYAGGAHVSSGIDSGIVSTLARKAYPRQKQFNGFSWSPAKYVPSGARYDERELVLKTCENAGIKPLFSEMDKAGFEKYVAGFYYNQGYFLEDAVTDQASGQQTNLIFTGWGGDEFISIGHSGVDLDLLRRGKLRTFFRRNPINKPAKFIRHFLFFVVFPAFHILDPRAVRSFRNEVRYVRKPFKKSDRKAISDFYFHTSRHKMHLNALNFYNLQERCESWGIMGFRKGIEYRYPLLDRRIIEYMLKVPSELLCKTYNFRPLLREIGKGILPENVRLNESKNDPVYGLWMNELYRYAGMEFMEEAADWRTNRDLHFIDFELLAEDIIKFKKSPGTVDETLLFSTLIYIKAIHEFTAEYRKGVVS